VPEVLAKAKRTKAWPIDFAHSMYYGRRNPFDIRSARFTRASQSVARLRRWPCNRNAGHAVVRGLVTVEEGARNYGAVAERATATEDPREFDDARRYTVTSYSDAFG
jgi:hypothetical protein